MSHPFNGQCSPGGENSSTPQLCKKDFTLNTEIDWRGGRGGALQSSLKSMKLCWGYLLFKGTDLQMFDKWSEKNQLAPMNCSACRVGFCKSVRIEKSLQEPSASFMFLVLAVRGQYSIRSTVSMIWIPQQKKMAYCSSKTENRITGEAVVFQWFPLFRTSENFPIVLLSFTINFIAKFLLCEIFFAILTVLTVL